MHNSSKCYLNASFNFYKTDYETQACQYGRLFVLHRVGNHTYHEIRHRHSLLLVGIVLLDL